MAKTKKQKELTAQVEQRLTESGPVRVDASAVRSGGERGHTLRVNEIHPSLEGGTERLRGLGVDTGTVTTPDGLSVVVSKNSRNPQYSPVGEGMSESKKGRDLPPGPQEGVSPRFEQRIGYEHGPEAAAKHVAEAEKIAARPNPLRSDGLVDAVMALHSPSVGGNRRRPGELSALARMDEQFRPSSRLPAPSGPVVPTGVPAAAVGEAHKALKGIRDLTKNPVFSGGRDFALHTLGYTPRVQETMLRTARDRIARRSANGDPRNRLSDIQIKSRAYEQVNEHLDEAIHGTRRVGHESALINDAIENSGSVITAASPGTDRRGIETDVPTEPGSARPQRGKGGGLGMTPKRTPEQRAQRATVRDLTRGGKWNGLRDADALETAQKNDVDLLTAKQKARRAGRAHPETFNTMAPGANVEAAARRHAQPVFSTNNPGVGVPSEGPNSKVLPPEARAGAVSPIPPNLPTEPAKIGRTREERGIRPSSFPTGSEPVVAAKPGKMRPVRKVAESTGGGIGDWSAKAEAEKKGVQFGTVAAPNPNRTLSAREIRAAQEAKLRE